MERYWLETGTKLHKTYESARNYGSDYSAPDGRHEVVFYADAQATIAALQAVIDDHHRLVREMDVRLNGEQGAAKQASLCDIASQLVALQARVQELEQWVQDQSTANLETMRHTDEMQSRAMEAEHQLTQRTAELEAIEKILDIDSGKTTVEKVRDLHHSFKQVWESYQDASNEMFKAQAELERVRSLIKALPKVEGEVTVRDITALCWANDGTYGSINCKEQLVSLLKHRQGMEGSHE